MIRGLRASSPKADRSSATRFARLASETNVPGQSRWWISSFETALGLEAIRRSRSANALGGRADARPRHKTSWVPESKTQSPKACLMVDERNREEALQNRDDFPLRALHLIGVPPHRMRRASADGGGRRS
jgi:hypothetical protein